MSENVINDVMFFEKNFAVYLPNDYKVLVKENYEKIFGTTENLKPVEAIKILINNKLYAESSNIANSETLQQLQQQLEEQKELYQSLLSENQLILESNAMINNEFVTANSKINFGGCLSDIQREIAKEFLNKKEVKDLITKMYKNKYQGFINKIDSDKEDENILNLLIDSFIFQAMGAFHFTPDTKKTLEILNKKNHTQQA